MMKTYAECVERLVEQAYHNHMQGEYQIMPVSVDTVAWIYCVEVGKVEKDVRHALGLKFKKA